MAKIPAHIRKAIQRQQAKAHLEAEARKAEPLQFDQVQSICIAARASLNRITQYGEATEQHWCDLAQPVNVSLLLCERGFGEDLIDDIRAAQDALMRAMHRGKRTLRYGLDGPGVMAIQRALDIHDQQIELVTRGEMLDVLMELRRRIDEGNVLEVVRE